MGDAHPPAQNPSKVRSRRWLRPWLLLVVVLYVVPLAGSTIATNPNETARVELAASLALWAKVEIGSAAEVYGLSEDVAIREGLVYSDKAPGLSIIAAPFVWLVNPMLPRAVNSDLPAYWPLRHVLTLLLVALPTVGLALLVGRAIPAADPVHRVAFTLIAALATPMWTYGTVFFGHAPAALLITLAWSLLLGLPDRDPRINVRRAAIGGVVAGFAVATEYPILLLVGVIFATLLVRRTRPPILAAALAGALVGMMPALIYHQAAFGAPWITGYSLKALGELRAIHERGMFGVALPTIEGLWGVLFSARRGIFFYCPLLVLAPLGLRLMVKERGWRDAGPITIASVVYTLFAAGFVDWQAGWCAAARHLVPIIPLLVVVALLAARELAKHRWGTALVVIVTVVSGLNAVLTIVLTPFFPPEFGAPFAELVLPSLADGTGFSNLLSSVFGIAPTAVAILVWVATMISLIWGLGRLFPDRLRWLAAVATAAVFVLLLAYWRQGSAPTDKIELMRAQVLRRLGHASAADRIEGPLISAPTASGD